MHKEFFQGLSNDNTLEFSQTEWLKLIREEANQRVIDLPVPSAKDEQWRFTDLKKIYQKQFRSAGKHTLNYKDVEKSILLESGYQLVFVDGLFSKQFSRLPEPNSGVFLGGLQSALVNHPEEIQATLISTNNEKNNFFASLNTSYLRDVAVLHLAPDTSLEKPIHLLNISTGENTCVNPRVFFKIGAGSSVKVLEEYVSIGGKESLTNIVSDIYLGQSAKFSHYRVQREDVSSFNIAHSSVDLQKNSNYQFCTISTGASISRQDVEVVQSGEGTTCGFEGLAFLQGRQVCDLHSKIIHGKPQGTSKQVYKTIIGDRAKAVFNGQIFVSSEGHLSSAAQSNKNLLLTKNGRVDTKPQLEIYADDVKCAHGATVGQLNDDEMFYLQTRGIPKDVARKILIYGFAAEVIENLGLESLIVSLRNEILKLTGSPVSL